MTPHGTVSTYRNHACRCAECRAANTAANIRGRQRRHLRMTLGIIDPPHGVYSTYTNYGCRCNLCKLASRVWRQKYTKRTTTDVP